MSNAAASPNKHSETVTIIISKEVFHLNPGIYTGLQLKTLAGVTADYVLFQIVKSSDENHGEDDVQINDDTQIEIKSGMRFRVVNPGTFGGPEIPPQLLTDVEALKKEGYEVEVSSEGQSIFGIIIRGFRLSPQIWNKDRTDLLVLTTAAYPKGKLDMFWVTPGLRLKNGKVPQGASNEESRFGKIWQCFSWHIHKWNPSRDSLVTYLREVVESRLLQGV